MIWKEVTMNKELQFLIYSTPQEKVKIDVVVKDETIWITQKTMTALFDIGIPAISKHLKNIFEEGKWNGNVVVSKMEITTQHGAIADKTQTQGTNFYEFGKGFSERNSWKCKQFYLMFNDLRILSTLSAEFKGRQKAILELSIKKKELSERLTERFGKGWRVRNLKFIRKFYLTYEKRVSAVYKTQIIEEQNRIVAILDKFETLVNDISAGLPAEIKMQRQQYKYYRNKLLAFDRYE
jgi:hypothetical protein